MWEFQVILMHQLFNFTRVENEGEKMYLKRNLNFYQAVHARIRDQKECTLDA